MAVRVRPTRDLEEYLDALGAIGHYFGSDRDPDRGERFSRILPFDRMHAAFDGTAIVGGAGVLHRDLQQRAMLRIERGIAEFLGVHFAQALITLDRNALLPSGLDGVQHRERPIDVGDIATALQLPAR